MSEQIFNRELAEKQAKLDKLQAEEKRLSEELESSPEYKKLVNRRFKVQEQVSKLRNEYDAAE